jgi:hypothetical protein
LACAACEPELCAARDQIERLTRVVEDQARALSELTSECPPWAPSLAIVYWKYAPTRWADASWDENYWRLVPLINALGDLPAAKLTPTVWAEHRAMRKTEADRRGARAVAIRDVLGHTDLATTQRYLRTSLSENAHHVAEAMAYRVSPRRAPSKSSRTKERQATKS